MTHYMFSKKKRVVTIGLPFACLIMKIILQARIDVSTEPQMRIQDPLGNQTLMKSNA